MEEVGKRGKKCKSNVKAQKYVECMLNLSDMYLECFDYLGPCTFLFECPDNEVYDCLWDRQNSKE